MDPDDIWLGLLGSNLPMVDAKAFERGDTWPAWCEMCVQRFVRARSIDELDTLLRILSGRFFVGEGGPLAGADHRATRVARLACGVSGKSELLNAALGLRGLSAKDLQPMDLAEHWLQGALKSGRAESPEFDAIDPLRVHVLLATDEAAPRGFVATLQLRLVPRVADLRPAHGVFFPSPASCLYRLHSGYDMALLQVNRLLGKYLARPLNHHAVMWDLIPPPGLRLLELSGASAGAVTALATLALVRRRANVDRSDPTLPIEQQVPGLRSERQEIDTHLTDIIWSRVAISACLTGRDDDQLAPVNHALEKLGALWECWTERQLVVPVPAKVFVANGQDRGAHADRMPTCADIPKLACEIANHTRGEIPSEWEPLHQHLLNPDPRHLAPPGLLVQAFNTVTQVNSWRAYLIRRYAHACRPSKLMPDAENPEQLESRFVELTLTRQPRPRAGQDRRDRIPEQERFTSLSELMEAVEHDSGRPGAYLIVGQPGGGKTTLLRHYEAKSARKALQQLHTGPDAMDLEICIWLDLRLFRPGKVRHPDEVGAWLERHLRTRYPQLPPLQDLLIRGSGLRLVADGINEIPAASTDERRRLVGLLIAWLEEHQEHLHPTLFSVREQHQAALGTPGFEVHTVHVQPWKHEQMKEYIRKVLPDRSADLLRMLENNTQLRHLHSVPINLAYQCELLKSKDMQHLATSRAELFSAMYWLRLKLERPRGTLDGPGVLASGEDLLIDSPVLWKRRLLNPPRGGTLLPQLEQQAQRHLPRAADAQLQLSLPESDAARYLPGALGDLQGQRQAWLDAACELGVAEIYPGDHERRFGWQHQLWLEYLSARWYANPVGVKADLPWGVDLPAGGNLKAALEAAAKANEALPLFERSKWEEVLKMALQIAVFQKHDPEPLLDAICACNAPLAGRAAATCLPVVADLPAVRRIRLKLLAMSTDPTLDLRLRLEAGLALGEIGDDIRYEELEGLYDKKLGRSVRYLVLRPEYWVPVGRTNQTYLIGSDENDPLALDGEKPQVSVRIRPVKMATMPVTNAEFRYFRLAHQMPEDGRWWDTDNWLARKVRFGAGTEFENPLQPASPSRGGVTWNEASAYCTWLTAQRRDGYLYRLPTEAEWEVAARGESRDQFPWGNNGPSSDHCNFTMTRLKRTSPVGCFPRGNRGRLADLSGNCWEWTSSRFSNPPNAKALTTAVTTSPGEGEKLALRGGGFGQAERYVRGAYRSLDDADSIPGNSTYGFRLVACRTGNAKG